MAKIDKQSRKAKGRGRSSRTRPEVQMAHWRGPETVAHGRRGVAHCDAWGGPLGLWLSISRPAVCSFCSVRRPVSHLRLTPRAFSLGQPVREEDDFAQNTVHCLNELRSGGMPQQGVCGATLRWSTVRLEGFTAEFAVRAGNSPPLLSRISWEESNPIMSNPTNLRLLLNALCHHQRVRLLGSHGADETAFCPSDFVMGVMSGILPSRRNRESSDRLWTPASLISTSVLQSLLHSLWLHPFCKNWRSSLERHSTVCSST